MFSLKHQICLLYRPLFSRKDIFVILENVQDINFVVYLHICNSIAKGYFLWVFMSNRDIHENKTLAQIYNICLGTLVCLFCTPLLPLQSELAWISVTQSAESCDD